VSTSSIFKSLRELRELSDTEIERRIDEQLAGGHVMMTVTFLRDELARRETAHRDEELLQYTREIRILTVAVAGATVVALAISVVALSGP
jgi:hypothetical protein